MRLRELTLDLYTWAAAYATQRGIILADTKLEFGQDPATGEILLADEVFTPDSSRFWPEDTYAPGERKQPSFDQAVPARLSEGPNDVEQDRARA